MRNLLLGDSFRFSGKISHSNSRSENKSNFLNNKITPNYFSFSISSSSSALIFSFLLFQMPFCLIIDIFRSGKPSCSGGLIAMNVNLKPCHIETLVNLDFDCNLSNGDNANYFPEKLIVLKIL